MKCGREEICPLDMGHGARAPHTLAYDQLRHSALVPGVSLRFLASLRLPCGLAIDEGFLTSERRRSFRFIRQRMEGRSGMSLRFNKRVRLVIGGLAVLAVALSLAGAYVARPAHPAKAAAAPTQPF